MYYSWPDQLGQYWQLWAPKKQCIGVAQWRLVIRASIFFTAGSRVRRIPRD